MYDEYLTDIYDLVSLYQLMKSDFGAIFWIHLVVIVVSYLLGILFSWYIVVGIMILYYFQLKWIGTCILTSWQFGDSDPDISYYWYYLSKLGLKLDKKKVNKFVDYGVPSIIVKIMIVYQFILDQSPIIY